MSYSRGTDNDRAARKILYRNGYPIAIAYDLDSDTEDMRAAFIQRIVDEIEQLVGIARDHLKLLESQPGASDPVSYPSLADEIHAVRCVLKAMS